MATRARARRPPLAAYRAAPLRLERIEPDPRPVHARAGPRRRWRPRAPSGRTRSCARCCCRSSASTSSLGRGCPTARAPSEVQTLRQRRVGRRRGDADRRGAVQRLLPQRTADEAAGAPRPAPGAVRRLCADAAARSAPATTRASQAALRAFELALLREIGVLPDLSLVTLTQQPVRRRAPLRAAARSGCRRAARRATSRLPGARAGRPAGRAGARQPRRRCSRPARPRCRR